MACHFTVVHSFQSAVAYYKKCLYYCLKSFAKHSPLISLVFCEILVILIQIIMSVLSTWCVSTLEFLSKKGMLLSFFQIRQF